MKQAQNLSAVIVYVFLHQFVSGIEHKAAALNVCAARY